MKRNFDAISNGMTTLNHHKKSPPGVPEGAVGFELDLLYVRPWAFDTS
jgi:hypothetical protein